MKYKINKGYIYENLGGKLVIFDSDESILYTFNQTASYIFKKIKTGKTDKIIITLISKRFKINETVAKKDFYQFVSDLKNNKIIFVK